MKREVLVLLLFVMSASGAPVPKGKPVPSDSTTYASQVDGPGASCLRKAYEEYGLVLSDVAARGDHFYLAQTYEAMGARHLEC